MSRFLDSICGGWCQGSRGGRAAGGALLAAVLSLGAVNAEAAPKRVALLVGVSDYAHARDLAGPRHDVEALREVLIGRWGFAAEDIRTLVDGQATKRRILEELERLQERSAPGDHVLFFFSGHGTSRFDPDTSVPLDPYSGAVLPHDAIVYGKPDELLRGLLVGRTDIRPLLSALDPDREVTVIYDACFSGNAVRGRAPGVSTRYQPVVVEDPTADIVPGEALIEAAPEYPYRNVYFVAASSDRETAWDIDPLLIPRYPTRDGKFHGAFSDALLRVLAGEIPADSDGDGVLDNTELKEAVVRRLAGQQIPHTPQALPPFLEDRHGLGKRAVFSFRGAAAAAGPVESEPIRLRVRLDGEATRLSESLSGQDVDLVGDGAVADLVITADRRDWYRIHSGDGELVGTVDQAALPRRIAQFQWFQALSERAATSNPFVFRLRLTQESCGTVLCFGDRITFNLETERPVQVLLLDLDANAAIQQLYPATAAELSPLPAGEIARWPISPNGTPDPIRVQEPEGTDLVLAFGFTESPGFLEASSRELRRDDPLLSQLQRMLERSPEKIAVSTFRLVAKRCDAALLAEPTRCSEATQ